MPENRGYMPSCFGDAYWCLRKDMITHAEYIRRLVAHFGGARHVDPDPVDEDDDGICPRAVYDRFASAVRQVTVEKDYRPVRGKAAPVCGELCLQRADLKSYEKLFHDCIANRYDEVIKNLESLCAKKPEADPTQPLAVLAAQHGHTKILKYCLGRGAIVDRNLGTGMMKGESKDPGMAKLVEQHMERIEEVLELRVDENGDIADSEMGEFDNVEW